MDKKIFKNFPYLLLGNQEVSKFAQFPTLLPSLIVYDSCNILYESCYINHNFGRARPYPKSPTGLIQKKIHNGSPGLIQILVSLNARLTREHSRALWGFYGQKKINSCVHLPRVGSSLGLLCERMTQYLEFSWQRGSRTWDIALERKSKTSSFFSFLGTYAYSTWFLSIRL